MTAHFEAKKHAYRQTQEGVVVSFVVHPNDVSSELATAPLGTRYMVAFSEIGDDDKPAQKEPEKPRQSFNELPRAQQAGILCADPQFQQWLSIDPDEDGATYAAETVRAMCGVPSRAKLDADPRAADKWDALVSKYRAATGQMAEVRG